MGSFELQPFMNWRINPNFNSPDWWKPYNQVKHNRIHSYTEANLKNVANALACLYVLDMKYIGERDNTIDVMNDRSKVFSILDYETKSIVVGFDVYIATENDIDDVIA